MAAAHATAEERESLQQRKAALLQQVEQLSMLVSFLKPSNTSLGPQQVLKLLEPFGDRSQSQTLLSVHCMSRRFWGSS